MVNILIGCEESQVITKCFRSLGHNAYSCDLQDTRGNPDYHLRSDIKELLNSDFLRWDLIILHPDCTSMAVSGNRWYGHGTSGYSQRLKQVEWTVDLWELAKSKCEKVALENPVSVIFKYLNADVQYIQPWYFGHGYTKKTGLALHNLPRLTPTNIVRGRSDRIHKMPPSQTRKRDRSETPIGLAHAIADQWGGIFDNLD